MTERESENIRYGLEALGTAIMSSSIAIATAAILCCLIIKVM